MPDPAKDSHKNSTGFFSCNKQLVKLLCTEDTGTIKDLWHSSNYVNTHQFSIPWLNRRDKGKRTEEDV